MARILIIEDDDLAGRMLSEGMTRLGHSVQSASNAEDGLRFFESDPSDVVITDIIMPDTDGLDVIGRIRSRSPKAPIIAISGGGYQINVGDCLVAARQLGADRVLKKPFTLQDLHLAVGELTAKEEEAPPPVRMAVSRRVPSSSSEPFP